MYPSKISPIGPGTGTGAGAGAGAGAGTGAGTGAGADVSHNGGISGIIDFSSCTRYLFNALINDLGCVISWSALLSHTKAPPRPFSHIYLHFSYTDLTLSYELYIFFTGSYEKGAEHKGSQYSVAPGRGNCL